MREQGRRYGAADSDASERGRELVDSIWAFWVTAVWGLAVLASWIGWGTLIAMGVSKNERVDWGLRAAWGMAATLAAGGMLVAIHCATGIVLEVVVLGGIGAWCAIVFGMKRPREVTGRTDWGWRIPAALLLAVAYLGSVGARTSADLNWSDDMPIYLPLVKQMVQTGDLVQPYSLRRLSSYGGQQLLQAEILAVGSESNAYLIDKGLSLVIVVGLVWGMVAGLAGQKRGWAMLGTGLAVLVMNVPRVNTQSQMSGVVLFLGLLQTLRMQRGDWRMRAAAAGIVAAGLASLRMNYVPVAAIILAAAYGLQSWRESRMRVMEGVAALAAMALLVGPWAAGLWESSRSLLYPLMLGNQRPEYSGIYTNPMGPGEKMMWVLNYFTYWKVAILIMPLVCVFSRRNVRIGGAVYAAAVAGAVAVGWVFNTISEETFYRYTFPLLFAAAIGAAGLALGESRWTWRSGVAATWIGVLMLVQIPAAAAKYAGDLQEIWAWNTRGRVFAPAEVMMDYAAAQRSIPAGKGAFAAVSLPSLLDYARNPIYLGDELGVVAPHPGIPLSQGPDAVREYFLSKDIHYVMAVDFDSALGLYSRPVWERFRDTRGAQFRGDEIEHKLAPVVLKMQENIDALAAMRPTELFGQVRVIKLDDR